METSSEAETAIQSFLDKSHKIGTDPFAPKLVVIPEFTQERSWGWVIFYNSKEYLETKEAKDLVAGNAPYLVDRESGEMLMTGTSDPLETYIAEYEQQMGYADD